MPWPDGSVGWSIILYTKELLLRSPVEAHTEGNQSLFLSLSLPFPLPLFLSKINKHTFR